MKILIVGGGISSLYFAYKCINLFKTNLRIYILEKNDYLGGRVLSDTFKGEVIEAGAGRFCNSHTLLLELIKELNIPESEIIELPSNYGTLYNGEIIENARDEPFNRFNYIGSYKDWTFNKVIKKLLEFKNNSFTHYITLSTLINIKFDSKVSSIMKHIFGYQAEFTIMCAYYALHSFEHSFKDNIKYLKLKSGLSLIVTKLTESLENSQKCKIVKNIKVVKIDNKRVKFEYNNHIQSILNDFDKIVYGIPHDELLKLLPNLCINHIIEKPLVRVYALFNNNIVKTHIRFPITTNSFLGQIIPTSNDNLFMISYTDSFKANEIIKLHNNYDLKCLIEKEIEKLFNIQKCEITDYKIFIWNTGTHCKKYYKPHTTYHWSNNIFIGEAFSEFNQAWIEGALESVENTIHFLSE